MRTTALDLSITSLHSTKKGKITSKQSNNNKIYSCLDESENMLKQETTPKDIYYKILFMRMSKILKFKFRDGRQISG